MVDSVHHGTGPGMLKGFLIWVYSFCVCVCVCVCVCYNGTLLIMNQKMQKAVKDLYKQDLRIHEVLMYREAAEFTRHFFAWSPFIRVCRILETVMCLTGLSERRSKE